MTNIHMPSISAIKESPDFYLDDKRLESERLKASQCAELENWEEVPKVWFAALKAKLQTADLV